MGVGIVVGGKLDEQDNLAQDATVAGVKVSFDASRDEAEARSLAERLLRSPHMRPYARDGTDRLIVNIGTSGTTITVTPNITPGSTSSPTNYNTAGSQWALDAREQHAAMTRANFNAIRARWTVTP